MSRERLRPSPRMRDYWDSHLRDASVTRLEKHLRDMYTYGVAYPGAPRVAAHAWTVDMRWLYGQLKGRIRELNNLQGVVRKTVPLGSQVRVHRPDPEHWELRAKDRALRIERKEKYQEEGDRALRIREGKLRRELDSNP
jgi:hypothetical protein